MRTPALRLLAFVIAAAAIAPACQAGSGSETGASENARVTLILGAYTTPREAYGKAILPAFREHWKQKTGQDVEFQESYQGSGAQSRAIVGGFEADIAALSLEADVDKIADAGLITHDWRTGPHGGMVSNSIAVIAVRTGNPKGIRDWGDLARSGLDVLTPDPKTSGGAQWNINAIYGAAIRGHVEGVPANDPAEAERFLSRVFRNVRIMDKGARESITNFERGVGDAAITYENEVLVAQMSTRNRGIMALLRWADGRARLQAGGWVGAGERGETNDGKQLAARLEFEPWAGSEDRMPLVLALAVVTNGYFGSPRDTLVAAQGDTTVVEDASYATGFEGWIELGKYAAPGLHIAGNLIAGDNPLAPRVEGGDVEFASFLGMQVWGEYVFQGSGALTGIGLGGRVDRFDPDTDADENAYVLWTPLVNLYFGKAFKLQANLDVLSPESEERDRESAVRVQAQLVL